MTTHPPVHRTPIHTRVVTYQGFARSDGMWDIEGTLRDSKGYDFDALGRTPLPAGAPVHEMRVCVTIDDSLTIVAIDAAMLATPFGECQAAVPPVGRLVGALLGKGWRKAVDDAIGGTCGCTHVRELLYNIATAAIQAVPAYREHLKRQWGAVPQQATTPPHYVGGCIAWRLDGPVVKQHYPQFSITSST